MKRVRRAYVCVMLITAAAAAVGVVGVQFTTVEILLPYKTKVSFVLMPPTRVLSPPPTLLLLITYRPVCIPAAMQMRVCVRESTTTMMMMNCADPV